MKPEITNRGERQHPEYVSFVQAVERRDWLSTRSLRRLVAERKVPFFKVGHKLVFDLADIDAYVEARRVEPVTSSYATGRREYTTRSRRAAPNTSTQATQDKR